MAKNSEEIDNGSLAKLFTLVKTTINTSINTESVVPDENSLSTPTGSISSNTAEYPHTRTEGRNKSDSKKSRIERRHFRILSDVYNDT